LTTVGTESTAASDSVFSESLATPHRLAGLDLHGGDGPIAVIVRGDRCQLHAGAGWQTASSERLTPVAKGAFAGFVAYEIAHVLEPTSTSRRPGMAPGLPSPEPAWGFGGWMKLGKVIDPPSRVRDERVGYTLSQMRSVWGREGYTHAVRRAVELIHAGDMYQVNLAHALVGRLEGSARALYADLAQAARPAFGCYLELPPLEDGRCRAVLSLSPELLLRYDARTRRLTTEPMKGTRPGTDAGFEDLHNASKDQAELAMIVDLMRNDVGRVSEIGSVQVEEPRMLERHGPNVGSVWQASARVRGTLRSGLTLDDALRAMLPAGSITGAPKVRAMQVIHELEPTPRGPYCGAVGVIDEHGNAELAVGIRTAIVVGDELRYAVGAGIVAQSDPEAEWSETLAKAGPLRAIGASIWDDG